MGDAATHTRRNGDDNARVSREPHPRLPVLDLGAMSYADAFDVQLARHAEVLALRETRALDDPAAPLGVLLLVEHTPPVITVSRRPDAARHLLASRDVLDRLGVEVQPTDRGGDITYHGPGQLVAYPIIDLNRVGIRLHDYMRLLEDAVIAVCRRFGVDAHRDPDATGVWTRGEGRHQAGAKLCAVGVRVRRWVSMHGLALNVATNLDHFDLIVPCGLTGRAVTSLNAELAAATPSMDVVQAALVDELAARLVSTFDERRGAEQA